jgi:rhodanese-related sulfurtransferase
MLKPTKVATALLIATGENEGILDRISKKLEQIPPRVLPGSNRSLRNFISTDLKSFMQQTRIVLDVSAFQEFGEQGDEFISLLGELQQKHENAKIIVYCADFTAGDLFLHNLVKSGYTNVIAGYSDSSEKDCCDLIQADLTEALTTGLSEQKYSRFVLPEAILFEDESAPKDTHTNPDYSLILSGSRAISVFGSQRRIGVTTFAMSLCKFVAEKGGKVALVLCCSDGKGELECISKYFAVEIKDDFLCLDGVEIFASESDGGLGDFEKFGGYNLVVYDCGDINLKSNGGKVEKFGTSDKTDAIYLCCGVNWKELGMITKAHEKLNGLRYTAVANADAAACEAYRDVLCGNLNSYAAVDFRCPDSVGEVVFGK